MMFARTFFFQWGSTRWVGNSTMLLIRNFTILNNGVIRRRLEYGLLRRVSYGEFPKDGLLCLRDAGRGFPAIDFCGGRG
jgi:hypothetical protein